MKNKPSRFLYTKQYITILAAVLAAVFIIFSVYAVYGSAEDVTLPEEPLEQELISTEAQIEETSWQAAEETSSLAEEETPLLAAEEVSQQAEETSGPAEEASGFAVEEASQQAGETSGTAEEASSEQEGEEPTINEGEGNQEDNADEVIQLGFLPIQIEAKVPEKLVKGEFYKTRFTIKNITNQTMSQLVITLSSQSDGIQLTSYKDEDEAKTELDKLRQQEENGIYDEEAIARAQTKVVRQISLYPGQEISTDVVLLALEDLKVDEFGVPTNVSCEFLVDEVLYSSKDTWRLPAEKETEKNPDEEPETTNSDTDSEIAELMNQLIVRMDMLTAYEEEIIDWEDPTQSEETPTLILQEEETVEYQLIDTGEEESSEEEEIYADDWVTYYDANYASGTSVSTTTPYVLLQSYSHKKEISPGDAFTLDMTFLNTGQKTNMEGVVIKIETSESLAVANGSNTLFVSSLNAEQSTRQKINLEVLADCKTSPQKVNLTIAYEYVENNERKQGSASETISIPVIQKERLEVRDPSYDEMEAGQEGVISVSYINKGLTSIYNMEAVLELADADAEQKIIYAGNVEAGKSGSLNFIVTPYDEGDYTGSITLTYENALQKEESVVIPLEFTSTMSYVEDDWEGWDEDYYEDDYDSEEGIPYWVWIAAGGAALVVIIIIAVIVTRKRKRKDLIINADDWFKDINQEGNS